MRSKRILTGTVACLLAGAASVAILPSQHHAAPAKPVAAKWSDTPTVGEATWSRASSVGELAKGRDVVVARVTGSEPGRWLCPSKVGTPSASRCIPTTYITYRTTRTLKGSPPATFKAFFVGRPGGLAVDEDPFPNVGDDNLMFLTSNCTPGVECFSGPDGRFEVHGNVLKAHAKGGVAGRLNGRSVSDVEAMLP